MIHLFCSKADRIFVAQNQSDRAATAEAQVQAVQKYGAEATLARVLLLPSLRP
jgi:hypothetical protein